MFDEKTFDLPVDGAVDVVTVSSGYKKLINQYFHELILSERNALFIKLILTLLTGLSVETKSIAVIYECIVSTQITIIYFRWLMTVTDPYTSFATFAETLAAQLS